MNMFDRNAAYAAARAAADAVARAAPAWPPAIASTARAEAERAVEATAESVARSRSTAARRRCVREALIAALRLAAACEVAGASGGEAVEARRAASRAIVALAMLLHASGLPD